MWIDFLESVDSAVSYYGICTKAGNGLPKMQQPELALNPRQMLFASGNSIVTSRPGSGVRLRSRSAPR